MVKSTKTTIRWGIVGTGVIASLFTKDLAYAEQAIPYAVGSRSQGSADRFASEHGIPHAYGSYEELVTDPELDAIYIATPHPYHREHALLALRAGKSVLCEKPFTINTAELEELVSYARAHKLFLMEGMWTRFLPAIAKVREWIQAGRIGEVQIVKADIGFVAPFDPESRLLKLELGGGALLDVGIYPISFASMIFGQQPVQVHSTAHIGTTGADEHFTVMLDYGAGRSAALHAGVRLKMAEEAIIYGTEGYIRIPSFLNAHSARLYSNAGEVEVFEDPRTSHGFNFEQDEVRRCLLAGSLESSIMPLDESLAITQLMDSIRGQWGLRYPSEG